MRTAFLQLERSFFDHPKTGLLIEKHGLTGVYCLLFIWSEMMHRNGIFDATNDYDTAACARKCLTNVEQVLNIIATCVKLRLLTPIEKRKGFYQKDRIDEALGTLESVSKSRSDAGKASAEAKKAKKLLEQQNLTSVEQIDNKNQQDLNKVQLLTNELSNKLINQTTEGSGLVNGEASNGTPLSLRGQAALTPQKIWTGIECWKALQKAHDITFSNAYDAGKVQDEATAVFDKILAHPEKDEIFAEIKIDRENRPNSYGQFSTVYNLKVCAWYLDKNIFPELGDGNKPVGMRQMKDNIKYAGMTEEQIQASKEEERVKEETDRQQRIDSANALEESNKRKEREKRKEEIKLELEAKRELDEEASKE